MNQLTRFRYDAVIQVGGAAPGLQEVPWLDWQRQKLSLDEIHARLTAEKPEVLAFRGIPNLRVDPETVASQWLRAAEPGATVAQLRAYLAGVPSTGVEPDRLAAVAAELGYRTELSWLNCGPEGAFDAELWRWGKGSRCASAFP